MKTLSTALKIAGYGAIACTLLGLALRIVWQSAAGDGSKWLIIGVGCMALSWAAGRAQSAWDKARARRAARRAPDGVSRPYGDSVNGGL